MKINDRYTLSKTWPSGGMGEIFVCFDEHLGREVVVKRLRQEEENRRIVDEQKALLRLRSKHVVQLFDIVEVEQEGVRETGLVLEYIRGEELQPSSYQPDRDYLYILWQICCGLSDIHSAEMVHRDIKPNNILLDAEGVIKIIDFGLSRTLDCANTRSVIGTPYFMAPELWRGNTINFDAKVDVYAFGITALMLLSSDFIYQLGHPPVALTTEQVKVVCAGLSEDACNVLARCVHHDPAHRPSIGEVKTILERSLLRDKHKALVILNGGYHYLDSNNRKISLNARGGGGLSISYDGYDFKVDSASGSVFLNNVLASTGQIVPGCCVITFGKVNGPRTFVTFDVSNPEVLP